MNEKNILSDILGKYFFSAFRQICNFFIVLCTSSFYEIQSLFLRFEGKRKAEKEAAMKKMEKVKFIGDTIKVRLQQQQH